MSALLTRSLLTAVLGARATGAVRIDALGNHVGVDFATTSAQAATLGTKTYTIGTNRGWLPGDQLVIIPENKTANMSMTGTVTSYSGATLVAEITAVGSDTTTTQTSWRIGMTGPRLEHNFASPFARRGFNSESTRTNSIRNSIMIGTTVGTVGSGGVLPTNWTFPTTGGLSIAVIGTGTERGLDYVDLRFFGTTSATSCLLRFDSTTSITHVAGSLWCMSAYLKVAAGNLTNVSAVNQTLEELDASSNVRRTTATACAVTANMARFMKSLIADAAPLAATSRLCPGLQLTFSSGVAVDVTLRVYGVQLEQHRASITSGTCQAGSTATTIVLASGASSTDSFYNSRSIVIISGTGQGQTNTISSYVGATRTATVGTSWGVTPDATSVYSIYYSETMEDAATSFIPTRTVTHSRNADPFTVASFAAWMNGLGLTEGTFFLEATRAPFFDTTPAVSYRGISCNSGSNTERFSINVSQNSGNVGMQSVTGGATTGSIATGAAAPAWGANVRRKVAAGYKLNSFRMCADGGVVGTDNVGAVPVGLTQLELGAEIGVQNWNCIIHKVRFMKRLLADAEFQAITGATGL